jgi:hypothetical protein
MARRTAAIAGLRSFLCHSFSIAGRHSPAIGNSIDHVFLEAVDAAYNEDQIKDTYLNLRAGAAAIAFVFLLLLRFGGMQLAGVPLWECTSAYRWATIGVLAFGCTLVSTG